MEKNPFQFCIHEAKAIPGSESVKCYFIKYFQVLDYHLNIYTFFLVQISFFFNNRVPLSKLIKNHFVVLFINLE